MTRHLLALLLVSVSVSASYAPAGLPDDPAPIALEWNVPGTSGWYGAGLPTNENYIRFRLRCDPDVHAGTWTEVTGRVWFHDDFFDQYGNNPMYTPFREPDLWDVATLWEPREDLAPPLCKLEESQYEAIVYKNEGVPFNDLVDEHSQPLLGPVGTNTESYRSWDTDYSFWSSDTLVYWQEVAAHDWIKSLVSKDALVKRLVLDQQPALTPAFFTDVVWEHALSKGVYVAIQGVTLSDAHLDPELVTNDETNPPTLDNGLGGWVAKGTTTLIPPNLIGWQGGDLPYPWPLLPSPTGVTYVKSGAPVVIEMSGLRMNMSAVLRIDGVENAALAPLSSGRKVQDAVFTMPTGLSRGIKVEVTGFDHPEGDTSLPPSHYYGFVIR